MAPLLPGLEMTSEHWVPGPNFHGLHRLQSTKKLFGPDSKVVPSLPGLPVDFFKKKVYFYFSNFHESLFFLSEL